jgi:hypothetical protein
VKSRKRDEETERGKEGEKVWEREREEKESEIRVEFLENP